MRDGLIIEVAVMNATARIHLGSFGLAQTRSDHYWRIRWMDGGDEIDHIEQIDDLATMTRLARPPRAGRVALLRDRDRRA